jgi:hypothetical protein
VTVIWDENGELVAGPGHSLDRGAIGLRLLGDVIAKFLLQPRRYGDYRRNPVWLCGLCAGHLSKPAYLPGVGRFLCQTAYIENDGRCEQGFCIAGRAIV